MIGRFASVTVLSLVMLCMASQVTPQDSLAAWKAARERLARGVDPAPSTTTTPAQIDPGVVTTAPTVALPPTTGDQPLVTYSAEGDSLGFIAGQIGLQADVSIIVDTSIPDDQKFYFTFIDVPLDQAMRQMALAAGGAEVIKIDERTYLITLLKRDTPLFFQYAETAVYRTRNESAADVHGLLSAQVREYVTLRADVNMLAVTAPRVLKDAIMRQIEMIDSPARQIVVEALVTEVDVRDGDDLGFSWSWRNFAVDDALGVTYSRATFQDVANLKALIKNQRGKIRAQTKLASFEGRESEFFVGTETYYSILTGNVNFPTAQIQQVSSGVTLKFTALVGDDGWITLKLEPEVSNDVAGPGGAPTKTVRRASTTVRVRSGETVAIGGLLQESEIRSVQGIPIISQIPLIGDLFKRRTTEKRNTEVIVMVTPHIEPLRIGG